MYTELALARPLSNPLLPQIMRLSVRMRPALVTIAPVTMRRAIPLSLILAGVLALAACDKPAADTPRPAPAPPVPPSGPLAIIMSPVDTIITLGSWMSSHPGDVVQDSVPQGALRDLVCRIAAAPMEIGGRHLVRQAVFNIPNPPEGETLPTSAQLAEQQCHLSGIWLATTESDSARGIAFADSLARMLNVSLGQSRPGVSLRESFASFWMGARSWSGPGTTVVLGVLKSVVHSRDGDTDEAEREGRVILASIAPHSGFDSQAQDTTGVDDDHQEQGEHDLELVRADSALEWMKLPALAAEVRPVLALYRTTSLFDSKQSQAFDSVLVHVASAVRDEGPSLEPSRRAALLFAADVVFDRGANEHLANLDADDSLANTLKAVGAPLYFGSAEHGVRYDRHWLADAFQQDSLGRAGHAALVSLLARGWVDYHACDGSSHEIDAVLGHGDAFLKRGEADPSVEYYLGIANHDLVAINLGGYGEFVPWLRDKPPVAQSRARALEHLRAALARPLDRRMRRHAWRLAVALMLGHSLNPRYFCIEEGD
jgi:hypothetical protein